MNYTDGILHSQYRGPFIFNDATKTEGKEPPPAEPAPEGTEPGAGDGGDPGASPGAEGDGSEVDPLEAPNPFEEGTPQATAFEKQREGFKKKLEKERAEAEARATSRIGSLEQKLDTVLSALPAAAKPPEAPASEMPKATKEDLQIVADALTQLGINPQEMVKERRRTEVSQAIEALKQTYPGVTFNPVELVKFANDNGISRLGGSVQDILELAFVRKYRAEIAKPAAAPPATPPKEEKPVKKVPVEIHSTSTKTAPNPSDKKPMSIRDRIASIRRKRTGDEE